MSDRDWAAVAETIQDLYKSTDTLERLFPGRKFTLDGHLVGSIGEVIAAFMFYLKLNVASTKGHDAISQDGQPVEIKFTHGKSVAFRHQCDHAIVLARENRGTVFVVYNGPGDMVWDACGKLQKNGQRSISISKLKKLDGTVPFEGRLAQINEAPI